jgi:hypothetical protein
MQQRDSCSLARQSKVQWIVEAQKIVACNVIPLDRVERCRQLAVVSPDRVQTIERNRESAVVLPDRVELSR